MLWWKVRDKFELASSYYLIAIALVGAVIGKGKGRVTLLIAALTGYLMWVTYHLAIL